MNVEHRTSKVDVASLRFFNKIETPKAYHNSTLEVRCSTLEVRFLVRFWSLKFRIWNLSFDFAQDLDIVFWCFKSWYLEYWTFSVDSPRQYSKTLLNKACFSIVNLQ